MQANIRQRVVGALVLIAIIAIFLPLFFTNKNKQQEMEQSRHHQLCLVNLTLPPTPSAGTSAEPAQLVAVQAKQQQNVTEQKPPAQQPIMQLRLVCAIANKSPNETFYFPGRHSLALKVGYIFHEVNSKKLITLLKTWL